MIFKSGDKVRIKKTGEIGYLLLQLDGCYTNHFTKPFWYVDLTDEVKIYRENLLEHYIHKCSSCLE